MQSITHSRKIALLSALFAVAIILAVAGLLASRSQPDELSYDNVVKVETSHPMYDTVDELKKEAPYIFKGNIKSSAPAVENTRPGDGNNSPAPFTEYQVEVEKIIKGNIESNEIILRQLGGVKSNTKYVVEGHPKLVQDKSYVIFAIKGEGKYGALAGGSAIGKVEANSFTLPEATGVETRAISITKLQR